MKKVQNVLKFAAFMTIATVSGCVTSQERVTDEVAALDCGDNCDPGHAQPLINETIGYGESLYDGARLVGGVSCQSSPPVGMTCTAQFNACTDYGCGRYYVVCDSGSCYSDWP